MQVAACVTRFSICHSELVHPFSETRSLETVIDKEKFTRRKFDFSTEVI